MISSTTRGGGFRGLLDYAFGAGKLDKHDRATLFGGTLIGRNPRELAREFGGIRAMRPECKNPVKHVSFSVPEGEHLTPNQWLEVGSKMAQTMGYDAWILIGHDDKAHEDVHFIGSRITKDGRIIRETMHGFAMTEAVCREMETKFGLRQVVSPERLPSGRKRGAGPVAKVARPEQKMMDRTGQKSWKVTMQEVATAVLATHPTTMPQFEAALSARGINIIKKVQRGEVTGLTYIHRETGEKMKGKDLGELFKAGSIQAAIAKNQEASRGTKSGSSPATQHEPSIAERRAIRAIRARRAATRAKSEEADRGPGSEALSEGEGKSMEPMVVAMDESMDGGARRSTPGPGAEPGLGGELGLGDRGGPGADPGLSDADRGGLGQTDAQPGTVGWDTRGPETGRPGGTPEPGDGSGTRTWSEPVGGPVPNSDAGVVPELAAVDPEEIRGQAGEALEVVRAFNKLVEPSARLSESNPYELAPSVRTIPEAPYWTFETSTPPVICSDVEGLAFELRATTEVAEPSIREVYTLGNRPDSYYKQDWEERKPLLTADAWSRVREQARDLVGQTHDHAQTFLQKLGNRLEAGLRAASRWMGWDLVESWAKGRHCRKLQRELAQMEGRPFEVTPLPTVIGELEDLQISLDRRVRAAQDATRNRERTAQEQSASKKAETPQSLNQRDWRRR